MRAQNLCAATLFSALCAACPEEDPPTPISCPLGDLTKPIELEIVHKAVGGGVTVTTSSGAVPLILPPQGGKVMLVGVRARNVDGCPLTLTAAMRDTCTGDLIALERRPILLEEKNGWLEPQEPLELNNYSNLPACPREGLTRSVSGEPYQIEVVVEDKTGRQATKSITIIPTCAEPENEMTCRCECRTDFSTIDNCDLSRDAGVPTSTCS